MALSRAWMRAVVAALLFALLAVSAQAKVGDAWVTDPGDPECATGDAGAVYSVDPITHAITLRASGGDLRNPQGIAASPDGNVLWVADSDAFDPAEPPTGCAAGPGGIIAVDTNTGKQTVLSNGSSGIWQDPVAIAWDPSTHTLVVVDRGLRGVYRVDPATGAQSVVHVGAPLVAPDAVAVAPDGTIFVADPAAGPSATPQILELDAASSFLPVDVADGPGLHSPQAMAIEPGSTLKLMVSDLGGTSPGFVEVVPNPSAPSSAANALPLATQSAYPSFCNAALSNSSAEPWAAPDGIAVAPDGSGYLVADPAGPAPMWCAGTGAGVLMSLSPSGSAAWLAGSQPNDPWIRPTGVAAAQNRAPVAVIGVPATAQPDGQSFVVDASHSSDPDGDPLTYRFDLDGDGVFETDTGSTPSATASFAAAGVHQIVVQVRDEYGAVGAAAAQVTTVAQSPIAQVPIGDPGGVLPPRDPGPPSLHAPAQITLHQLLNPGGVPISLTCSADCTVTGTLQISLGDFKSLTAAAKLLTLGRGSVKLKAGKKGTLRIKLTPRVRRKLKLALGSASAAARRKIRLYLTASTKYRSGKKKTIRRKIVLRG